MNRTLGFQEIYFDVEKTLLKVSGTPGIFKVGTSGYRTTTIGTWITKSLPFRDLSIFEEYESSGEDILGDTTMGYQNQDSSKTKRHILPLWRVPSKSQMLK